MLGLGATKYAAAFAAVALGLAAPDAAMTARADDTPPPPPPPKGVGPHEVWAGADGGSHNWLVYSGTTYAPWSDIHADGFRLRATGGYGGYSYSATLPGSQTPLKVRVVKTYGDVLAGYQMRVGELTAKAFVGWSMIDDVITVPAWGGRGTHVDTGAKGAVELWLNMGPSAWGSLDANYTDTQQAWSVRSRVGYRVLPTVSLGAEGIFNALDRNGTIASSPASAANLGDLRAGAFVRYEWFGGEISASGGVSSFQQSGTKSIDLLRDPAPYGTVNWIMQF